MAFLQREAFERLRFAHASNRLAHAYLITGPEGAGKSDLAKDVAGLILDCSKEDVMNHPDLHRAEPESKSRRIVVSQVRELQKALYQKPMRGREKVAMIFDADRLQPQAANAFLKTLEEPPAGTHVFLLTSQPDMLLDTILSRCLSVSLRREKSENLTVAQKQVVDALSQLQLKDQHSGIAETFQFVRTFLGILQQTRSKIRKDFEEALQAERELHKDTVDESWFRLQDEQDKARAEALVSMERARLLACVVAVFAEALRIAEGVGSGTHAFSEVSIKIADQWNASQLLQRSEILDQMITSLDRNVNESLALESGFLRIFSPIEK